MTNGSTLASFAYLKDEEWHRVGSLVYFRTHDVRIRLKTLPLWAMYNNQWMLSTFHPQFKVEDAPYLDGDIIVKDGKEVIKIGRLISYQNDTGETSYYMIKLDALPADRIKRAMECAEPEKKVVWLDVQLSDKE